jgi:anti-anti-sigma regulatory factor
MSADTDLQFFVRLQKAIREMPAELRVCGLHPEFKKLLEEKGLLRHSELSNNLQDALKSQAG